MLDLFPQREHMRIYRARIINRIWPSTAQQINSTQRLALGLSQYVQQTKLLRRQVDKLAHIAHPSLDQVNMQLTAVNRQGRRDMATPPSERGHSRQKLLQSKRIIIIQIKIKQKIKL